MQSPPVYPKSYAFQSPKSPITPRNNTRTLSCKSNCPLSPIGDNPYSSQKHVITPKYNSILGNYPTMIPLDPPGLVENYDVADKITVCKQLAVLYWQLQQQYDLERTEYEPLLLAHWSNVTKLEETVKDLEMVDMVLQNETPHIIQYLTELVSSILYSII
jgi:hypothetical protein